MLNFILTNVKFQLLITIAVGKEIKIYKDKYIITKIG